MNSIMEMVVQDERQRSSILEQGHSKVRHTGGIMATIFNLSSTICLHTCTFPDQIVASKWMQVKRSNNSDELDTGDGIYRGDINDDGLPSGFGVYAYRSGGYLLRISLN